MRLLWLSTGCCHALEVQRVWPQRLVSSPACSPQTSPHSDALFSQGSPAQIDRGQSALAPTLCQQWRHARAAFIQRCFEKLTESPGCEWAGHSTGIDAWETLRLGVVHHMRRKVDLGADKGVVRVSVGAVHASGVLHVIQVTLPGHSQAELVPWLESWVAP